MLGVVFFSLTVLVCFVFLLNVCTDVGILWRSDRYFPWIIAAGALLLANILCLAVAVLRLVGDNL